MKNWIGVDISYRHFDAAFPRDGGGYEVVRFDQSEKGFSSFLDRLDSAAQVVIEQTGGYSSKLLWYLYESAVSVYSVAAYPVSAFKAMQGRRSKTDQLDAIAIGQYASHQSLAPWEPPTAHYLPIRQYCTLISQYKKQETALKNQLHALTLEVKENPIAKQSVQSLLKELETQRGELEKELERLLQTHTGEQKQLLETIPGLGKRTIAVLILLTHGFTTFDNGRQVAAFIGLTPTTFSSGSSVWRKPKISKVGSAYLRSLLYMCALSAIQYNQHCQTFYHRLIKKGKHKKVALVAVAHKLVKIAFAVVKSGKEYDPNFNLNLVS